MSCRIICNPDYASSPADIEAELMDDRIQYVLLAYYHFNEADEDVELAFDKNSKSYVLIDDTEEEYKINTNTIQLFPNGTCGFAGWRFDPSSEICKMLKYMRKNQGKVPQIEEWIQMQNFVFK